MSTDTSVMYWHRLGSDVTEVAWPCTNLTGVKMRCNSPLPRIDRQLNPYQENQEAQTICYVRTSAMISRSHMHCSSTTTTVSYDECTRIITVARNKHSQKSKPASRVVMTRKHSRVGRARSYSPGVNSDPTTPPWQRILLTKAAASSYQSASADSGSRK